jgi:SAM-dependent methyltransferase
VTQPDAALPSEYFERDDESADELFYIVPRLVNHIDERAIAAATELYRRLLPPNGAILDLMSSWVSHLPPERRYERVVGLGMNEEELRANPVLSERVVRNLNHEPRLPFEDAAFDGCVCTVSVQYLTSPVEVFAEVGRVLKPGAPVITTFSNRMFPTKAVAVWMALDDQGHIDLVAEYYRRAGCFTTIQAYDAGSWRRGDPLFGVAALRAKNQNTASTASA